MIKKFKLLDINIEIILNFRSFKKIFYLDRIIEKNLLNLLCAVKISEIFCL